MEIKLWRLYLIDILTEGFKVYDENIWKDVGR